MTRHERRLLSLCYLLQDSIILNTCLLPADRRAWDTACKSVRPSVLLSSSSTANQRAPITVLASDWLVWRHVPVEGINHSQMSSPLFAATNMSTCYRKQEREFCEVTSCSHNFKLFAVMKMTFAACGPAGLWSVSLTTNHRHRCRYLLFSPVVFKSLSAGMSTSVLVS